MVLTLVMMEVVAVPSGGGYQAWLSDTFGKVPWSEGQYLFPSILHTNFSFKSALLSSLTPGVTPNLFNEFMLKSKTKDQKEVRNFSFQLCKKPESKEIPESS